MGQGDPFGEHQAGVTRSTPAEYSVTSVPRIRLEVRLTLLARAD